MIATLKLLSGRAALRVVLLAGLATGLLAAPAQAQQIKKNGTLVVAINDNPPNFVTGIGTNILTIATGGQIFDTLIKVDSTFKVVPSLAKSWEASDDGLHFTFHMEPNVTWHDGKPFTADDVKYSILEIDGKYNSLAIASYGGIASIDTPDPLTVVINLKSPDPAFFPWAFSQPNFAQIFPKHIYEGTDPRTNPANLKPIGTGPFMFKEWVRGSYIVLERNPNYFHKDKVYIDRLVFQIIPDPGARQIALENGEIDHIPYFGLAPSSIEPLSANKNTQVIDAMRPALGEIIAFINLRNPILAKKEVRQALSAAIDRDVIVKLALNGRANPARGPIRSDNPPFFNSDLKVPVRDVAKANQLLDAAGYPRKGATRFAVRLSYSAADEGGALQSAAEIMREQMKDIGVDLQLQPSDAATWQEQSQQWNFDLSLGSYGTGPDPKIAVTRLYTTGNIRHVLGSNLMGYSNPAVDELLEKADKEMNPEARARLYRQAQTIMVDDPPALWLWEKFYPIAVRKGLVGLPSGSMHSEVFEGVGWTN